MAGKLQSLQFYNHATYIPNPLFAFNHSIFRLHPSNSNFQNIANTFQFVLTMSYSEDETPQNILQANPSKVIFADKAGLSNASKTTTKPSVHCIDTTNVTNTPTSTSLLFKDSFTFDSKRSFPVP